MAISLGCVSNYYVWKITIIYILITGVEPIVLQVLQASKLRFSLHRTSIIQARIRWKFSGEKIIMTIYIDHEKILPEFQICRPKNSLIFMFNTSFCRTHVFIPYHISLKIWPTSFFYSFITYLSIKSMFPVCSILNNLRPAIRQLNPVFSSRDITVTNGVMGIVVSVFYVVDGIREIEWHARLMMLMMFMMLMNSVLTLKK